VTVAGLAAAFGSGAMTNSIDEIEFTEVILATGTNTMENHPVIGMKVKRAVRRQGAKLIVIDPREIALTKYAHIWLRQKPGIDVAVLNGLMNVIISEGLYDKKYVEDRTEGFEAMAKADWEIIAALSSRMGYAMPYTSAEMIMEEIRQLTPSYAGITYGRIEKEGLQWPCPDTDHPGTRYLHKDRFSRGNGLHELPFPGIGGESADESRPGSCGKDTGIQGLRGPDRSGMTKPGVHW
jgi:predicted molibdopterin-dependent oxidoreductase YjgC